jgi:hypothetical protein
VLDGSLFGSSVNIFLTAASTEKATLVILPWVHEEVMGKIGLIGSAMVNGVRHFRRLVEKQLSRPIANHRVTLETTKLVGEVVTQAKDDTTRDFPNVEAPRINRIVKHIEALLIKEIYKYSQLQATSNNSLEALFDEIELGLCDTYTKYTGKYTSLIFDTKALAVSKDKLPPAQAEIGTILLKECGVKNRKDRIILAEAICLMYGKDCWTALVTNDTDDLLSNKAKIKDVSLLLVCDPLYAIPELRERFQKGANPSAAADSSGVNYKRLVLLPSRTVIV